MKFNNSDLGTGKILPLMLKLSIPVIFAQFINGLYNVVDRIYLGHIPNEGARILTGVGITFPIIMFISAFAMLIGAGGSPLASINLGAKNKEKAEDILNQGFTTLLIISGVITVVFYCFKEELIFLFGASENTFGPANDYMSIYLLGTVFVQLTIGLNAFISTQGFTKFSMITVLIGAITNIALDPIFIFYFNMGAKGAALATVISQSLSCIWVLKFLVGNKTEIKLKLSKMKVQKSILLSILALGISPFIMHSTEAVINFVFNSTLQRHGGDIAVGSMTIISSIMSFLWMPIAGLGQGCQSILSYNYGAGNMDRVKKACKILFICCLTYTISMQTLVSLYPHVPVQLFTADKELVNYTCSVLGIFFLAYGIFGLQSASQQIFLALGQAKVSLFLALLRKIFLLVPLVYILSSTSLKTMGVFIAEPISDAISATTALILFLVNIKKILNSRNKSL